MNRIHWLLRTCLWLGCGSLAMASTSEDRAPSTALESQAFALGLETIPDQASLVFGSSAILGKLTTLTQIEIEDGLGERIPISSDGLAALSGGHGIGKRHRVYFLDGSVLSGTLHWQKITFEGDALGSLDLNPDDLEVLFIRKKAKTPSVKKGSRCIAFESGDRWAISPEDDVQATLSGSWGKMTLAAQTIHSMWSNARTSAECWVKLADGSVWNVLHSHWRGTCKLSGRSVSIQSTPVAIHQSWKSLEEMLFTPAPSSLGKSKDQAAITLWDGSWLPLSEEKAAIQFRDSKTSLELTKTDLVSIERVGPLVPATFQFTDKAETVWVGVPNEPVIQSGTAFPPTGIPWHLVREVSFSDDTDTESTQ